jgi:uncharacterized protein (TIGR02996 family)
MSRHSAPGPVPPMEVFAEFLDSLQRAISSHDRIIPVLRGSILLQRWFGDAARAAADIDLEWFPMPDWGGRFSSPIEHARALCMFAATDHSYRQPSSPIAFQETQTPGDGENLWDWDYGTPGLRCHTGWTWEDRRLRGILQIDDALAGSYGLMGISTETIELPRASGEPIKCRGYTMEMMLAAKLSWIVRNVRRETGLDASDVLSFSGEPKDLYDAHLLLTKGELRSEVFQSVFLTVAMEDKLDWRQLDVLLDQELALWDGSWSQCWPDFFTRNQLLLKDHPGEMLRTVSRRTQRLLGDVRDHLPFLRSIADDPADEVAYQVYADWLEERSDSRAEFLRRFCGFYFHQNESERDPLAALLLSLPVGWLYNLFGSPDRSHAIVKKIQGSRQEARSRLIEDPRSSGSVPSTTNTMEIPPADQHRSNEIAVGKNRPWWKFW